MCDQQSKVIVVNKACKRSKTGSVEGLGMRLLTPGWPGFSNQVNYLLCLLTCYSLRTDNHAMKKELSNARNERDNVQYRLNLLKEDLEVALQRKEEADRREKEEHESAELAKGQLVRGGEGSSTCDHRNMTPQPQSVVNDSAALPSQNVHGIL